jgi:hypothetical protein
MYKPTKLKVGLSSKQITVDNIEEITKDFGGTFEDGLLKFTLPSGRTHLALIDDWILAYDTGDVSILSDVAFHRMYEQV